MCLDWNAMQLTNLQYNINYHLIIIDRIVDLIIIDRILELAF